MREDLVIQWLDEISSDADSIFFLGDIFDFWMEYKYVVPKGFVRFLGKIAQLKERGINIWFFTGNHDMWMQDYLPDELGVELSKTPIEFVCKEKKFLVGHGDGLGPGDYFYKFLKVFFNSSICQWVFKRIHPNLGMKIAYTWSNKSRASKKDEKEAYKGDDEWLWQYCKSVNKEKPRDFYIFGHRHLPLDLPVDDNGARYINLGEWVSQNQYAVFDGSNMELKVYSP